MTLEAFKSTTGFNKATLYECCAPFADKYFEGKTAFAELKAFAKANGYTDLIIISNKPDKSYTLK